MAKDKTKKVLLMKNGAEYEITGDNGRFWLCGNTQFRKASSMIAEIKTIKEPAKGKKTDKAEAEEE